MANVTGLQDRGTYWIITYDDGGYDNIPKDLTKLAQALAQATERGQTAIAEKFRTWIENIKATGKPVGPPSMSTGEIALIAGGVVGAGLLVWWLWPTRRR